MAVPTRWIGSPNFTPNRGGFHVEAIVIHIMQGTLSDTDSWFSSSLSNVSAHYGISRAGTVHQYVRDGDTAWHAGRVSAPSWQLLKNDVNPNSYTIGIEHEGQTGVPWTQDMLAMSAALVAEIANRWAVPLDRLHIIGHGEIYAPKAFCPGTGVVLEDLIDRARHAVQTPLVVNTVPSVGVTTATSRLNVRFNAPSTIAPIVRELEANEQFSFVAWTSTGESVHNNPHWYQDRDGNFVWAGATTDPTP